MTFAWGSRTPAESKLYDIHSHRLSVDFEISLIKALTLHSLWMLILLKFLCKIGDLFLTLSQFLRLLGSATSMPSFVCDITSWTYFICVFILNPVLRGKWKKKYASFPISIILWFGTGICSFAEVVLFPPIWKSIWHTYWQATEKPFHSSIGCWLPIKQKMFFSPGICATWELFASKVLGCYKPCTGCYK